MQIEINENIEEQKDDFWRGFTLKQTISMVALGIVVGGGSLILYFIYHVPIEVATYIILPIGAIIAIVGFWPANRAGFTFVEMMKARKRVRYQPILYYKGTEFIDGLDICNDEATAVESKRNKQIRKRGKKSAKKKEMEGI